jgi:uncharacterized protein DUF6484
MATSAVESPRWAVSTVDGQGVCTGRIIEITEEGRPIVQFVGAPGGRCPARVATSDPGPDGERGWADVPVLLMLEDGDPVRPIIVGFVRDTLPARHFDRPTDVSGHSTRPVELSGNTLTLEGTEAVVLRSGAASITIHADGRVIIKGSRLTSRASETNKIRGATVLIN